MKWWKNGLSKRKIYDYNYNRSKKIDKQNENKEKTNDLQMFPPIDVNVLSLIHNDSKQELAARKGQHWIYYWLKIKNLKV